MTHDPGPHYYTPSIMHMGDCSICGNRADHPNHISPETVAERKHRLALAAAESAASAAADLARYAREGEGEGTTCPFEIEVIEQLLDAAKMAMEIEVRSPIRGRRGQVYGALVAHLEGWA